ncbi:MAG TPA: cupin domain-containing protein [Candidatus Bathyarchaeia archaeon]|nr:cupin domain-containing protein [Candidatus Bathyarchaeia archaeon]
MKLKETHALKRQLPMESIDGKYQWRSAEWGGFYVSFQKAVADVDFAPLNKEEPDGRCHGHHWGFVLKGKMIVRYKDHEEVIKAKEAYYLAPGHIPFVFKGTELLELTPKADIERPKDMATTNLQTIRVKKAGTKNTRV